VVSETASRKLWPTARQIRRAQKSNVKWGDWKAGHLRRSEFPLPKLRQRYYRLGSGYRYRVVEFQALDHDMRLWIGYHQGKEQYFAHAAVATPEGSLVIASLEFHGTHPGWHIHGMCTGIVADEEFGRLRPPSAVRIPAPRGFHRRADFGVTETNASDIAAKWLGLYKTGEALLC